MHRIYICLFCFFSYLIQPAYAEPLHARVINGSFVNPSTYSVAALVTPQGELCSGAVISSKAILTAAHCAFIGSRAGAFAYVRGVKYPLASGKSAPGGLDIGIVKTAASMKAARFDVPQGIKARVGQRFTLLGFGDPNPGRLVLGYMTIGEYINSSEFIAVSYQGQNACSGDSGGPAVINYRGRASIIGVVSRGPQGCRAGNSVIFPMTTTNYMARWIRQNS